LGVWVGGLGNKLKGGRLLRKIGREGGVATDWRGKVNGGECSGLVSNHPFKIKTQGWGYDQGGKKIMGMVRGEKKKGVKGWVVGVGWWVPIKNGKV